MDTTPQMHPVTSDRLGEVQTRAVTAILGIGADPDRLAAADVIDLCALITLRHMPEAVEIVRAWGLRPVSP